MHPLLSPFNRFGLYLLAWAPLTALLIYLMARPGAMGWQDATLLMVPLCLVYAFVCLSPWYSCKAAPLDSTPVQRLFLTHTLAALIVSLLWIQAGRFIASLLSQFRLLQGIDAKFAAHSALLFGPGFLMYTLAVASHYVILTLEESRAAQARVLETSILARDAELKALKAQINPHFLFNSLNSISALTSKDPARAQEMCILLADFLRMTLGLGEKALVTLREELDLLQRYLAIEKVRFGERLQVELHVETQAESCLLPPLILQPLVENAVVHGIAHRPEGGTIRISAERGERLRLMLENSVDPDAPASRKGGLGLRNVRQRVETRYGRDATITVTSEEDLFRVVLSLPVEAAPSSEPDAAGQLHPPKEVRA
jgi:two-component system, LytTR family, sensor histidine kinase AlgZ